MTGPPASRPSAPSRTADGVPRMPRLSQTRRSVSCTDEGAEPEVRAVMSLASATMRRTSIWGISCRQRGTAAIVS